MADEKIRLKFSQAQGQYSSAYIGAHVKYSLSYRDFTGGPIGNEDAELRRKGSTEPDQQEIDAFLVSFGQKRYIEAEASARSMTDRFPLHGFGWKALGVVLNQVGRNADALGPMQKATALLPDDAQAHNNLGIVLKVLGRLEDAVASYRRVLVIKPDLVEALNDLGIALRDLGRLEEAVAACRQALAVKPDYAEAHNNLGIALRDLGQVEGAVASCRRALEIRPDFVDAYSNLGAAFQDLGKYDEAVASYSRALEINPDFALAHKNLGILFQTRGQFHAAIESFHQALALKPDYIDAHSSLIFTLDLSGTELAALQVERRRWDQSHAAHLIDRRTYDNGVDLERRLRIGYVSADFKNHSAPKVFGALLTQFDSSNFEVFAYSNSVVTDTYTERFMQSVSHWRRIVGQADETVAELIRQDGIDILVDLSGHTAGNRLLAFARKPAPIQITAWGYAHGTGMGAMDVFFADIRLG